MNYLTLAKELLLIFLVVWVATSFSLALFFFIFKHGRTMPGEGRTEQIACVCVSFLMTLFFAFLEGFLVFTYHPVSVMLSAVVYGIMTVLMIILTITEWSRMEGTVKMKATILSFLMTALVLFILMGMVGVNKYNLH